jgi:hypothetical protein
MQNLLSTLSNSSYDLSSCLSNRSNRGQCSLDMNTRKFKCQCDSDFVGLSCQTDSRPCSSYPCLNNATCSNVNSTEFVCNCQRYYFGKYCENRVDLCRNMSCLNKGHCSINGNVAVCKCTIGYYGNECELEETSVKIVKSVQTLSITIAFLCIGFTILIVVSNDFWNFYLPRQRKKKVNFRKIKHYDSKQRRNRSQLKI